MYNVYTELPTEFLEMLEAVDREVVRNFIALCGRVGIVSLETSMYPTILDDTRFNFTFTCLTIFGRETSMYLVTESQYLLLQWQDSQTGSYASDQGQESLKPYM